MDPFQLCVYIVNNLDWLRDHCRHTPPEGYEFLKQDIEMSNLRLHLLQTFQVDYETLELTLEDDRVKVVIDILLNQGLDNETTPLQTP